MNSTGADLLVLGLGNVLLGDDGVGPAAVARLHDHHVIPDGVLCLDGGTLGLSLLPYLEDARMVVMVDAIAADAPAGVASIKAASNRLMQRSSGYRHRAPATA